VQINTKILRSFTLDFKRSKINHMITDNWKEQALQKIAASAPQDDKAVAEAFAQQAYTVIGNRDREIMRDPYMLGFEVVYKNEENTRLVGVFAFRLPSEILLAPVFYNNGQVKGQDLLYRKGANRFVPNTEKWVHYLLSRGETEEGRPISRRNSHARMNLDLAQLGGSRLKSAAEMCSCCGKEECDCSEDCECKGMPKKASGEVDIQALWKEAMDAWSVTEPQHLFADFLISSGMQKQASQLAGVFPEWAELLELSGALEKEAGWGAQPTEPAQPTESTVVDPEMLATPIVPAPQPFTVSEEEAEQKMASTVEQAQAETARLQQAGGSAAASNTAIQAGFTGPNKIKTPEFEKELDESIKEVLETPEMQSKLKSPITYPKTPAEQYMAPEQKKADVTLFLEPQPGWAEEQIQDFYKQGFALMDSRDMVGLTESFERSDYEQSLASITEPGIHEVRDLQGNTARVLWAPKMECKSDCRPMGTRLSYRRRRLTQPYSMLFLDGSDKGAYKDYCESTEETELPAFVMDQTWNSEKIEEGLDNVKAGKVYCAWVPSAGRITAPFAVASVKTVENVTKINFDTTCSGRTCPKMVINKELTGTDLDDSREGPLVLGGDAKFFEVQAAIEYEGPKSPANISRFSPVPPAEFRPVTVGRLGESLIKTKTASVKLIPVGRGRVDLMLNGKRRAEDLDKAALSLKLAGNLGLSIPEALDYAERGTKEVTEFNLISPRQKLKMAAAYYDRDIIPDEEFEDRDYDQDLDIPVYSPEENRAIVEFRRQQQVTAQPNYLDAMGYGGPRNRRHGAPQFIPDQVIMQMQNPVQQMAEIGQKLGLKSLMDHGAVGSMTKIFDAAPHIKKYVGQLEASLDFMARLLFMLFWKPKDFADIFGSDDIPNMENKLTGVFLAYGDLVLELKQSAGDDDAQTPSSM